MGGAATSREAQALGRPQLPPRREPGDAPPRTQSAASDPGGVCSAQAPPVLPPLGGGACAHLLGGADDAAVPAANTGLPTWLHLTTARAGHGKDSSSEWCTVMSPVCTRGLEKLNDLPRAPTAWKLSPGLPESRSPAPGTKPQLLQSGARVL